MLVSVFETHVFVCGMRVCECVAITYAFLVGSSGVCVRTLLHVQRGTVVMEACFFPTSFFKFGSQVGHQRRISSASDSSSGHGHSFGKHVHGAHGAVLGPRFHRGRHLRHGRRHVSHRDD